MNQPGCRRSTIRISGYVLAAAGVIGLTILLTHDFRTPRQLYRICYGVEIPAGATNVSARWYDHLNLVIQFQLPPADLVRFLSQPAPGCGPWHYRSGEYGPVELEDTLATDEDIRLAEHPQNGNESWTFVADISKRTIYAIDTTTGPFK